MIKFQKWCLSYILFCIWYKLQVLSVQPMISIHEAHESTGCQNPPSRLGGGIQVGVRSEFRMLPFSNQQVQSLLWFFLSYHSVSRFFFPSFLSIFISCFIYAEVHHLFPSWLFLRSPTVLRVKTLTKPWLLASLKQEMSVADSGHWSEGFPKSLGYPKMDGLKWKLFLTWHDLGVQYPHFRRPSFKEQQFTDFGQSLVYMIYFLLVLSREFSGMIHNH